MMLSQGHLLKGEVTGTPGEASQRQRLGWGGDGGESEPRREGRGSAVGVQPRPGSVAGAQWGKKFGEN